METVPNEVVVRVIGYLPDADVMRLASTCRRLTLVGRDALVWTTRGIVVEAATVKRRWTDAHYDLWGRYVTTLVSDARLPENELRVTTGLLTIALSYRVRVMLLDSDDDNDGTEVCMRVVDVINVARKLSAYGARLCDVWFMRMMPAKTLFRMTYKQSPRYPMFPME
jgi:hypothetical protein